MKKALPLCLLTLVLGGLLGWCLGQRAALPVSTPAAAVYSNVSAPPLDSEDDEPLLERGAQVLEALNADDYSALAGTVHPEKGVRFTPYSSVDVETDLVFSRDRLTQAAQDAKAYTWGVTDGRGSPLVASVPEYFARYVWNTDYTQAPVVSIDEVAETGNALENVREAYPEARFIEYHFPSLDPENEGFDWCSLKLVFEVWENQWYLVGMIHSEWTI